MTTSNKFSAKTIVTALTLFSLLSSTGVANATVTPGSTTINTTTEDPFTVQYVGEDEQYLVFQVNIKKSDFAKSLLQIDDKTEGILFSRKLSDDYRTFTFKIERKDNQSLFFKLTSGKVTYFKSFTVNSNFIHNTTVAEDGVATL